MKVSNDGSSDRMTPWLPSTATILCRSKSKQQLSTILKIGHREHRVRDAIIKLIDVSKNSLKRMKSYS